jgi:hypothetical protein
VIATGFQVSSASVRAPSREGAAAPQRTTPPPAEPVRYRAPAPAERRAPVAVSTRERTPAQEPVEEEPVISFPEILASGESMIEFAEESEEADEPVIMDNGSIRSFNADVFRVPTFVRKQMD